MPEIIEPLNEGQSNINEYEREKIKTTIADLELTANSLRAYLAYADELDSKQIKIQGKVDLSKLRHEDGLAGPDSDILKIQILAQRAQVQADQSAKAAGANVPGIREAVKDSLKKNLDNK